MRFIAILFLVSLTLAASTYYRITADELNLFTGMLFLLMLCSAVFLFSEITTVFLAPSENTKVNIRLCLTARAWMLFVTELFLARGLGRYANHHERNGAQNY